MGQPLMKVSSFQHCAGSRQNPHSETAADQSILGKRIVVVSQAKEVDHKSCKETHQKQVCDEDDDVQQQPAIVQGEEIEGAFGSARFV